MSKSNRNEYTKLASRMALHVRVSHAASRLSRQILDYYLGLGFVSVEVWEENGDRPGYRVAVEVHFDYETLLAAERRRISEIVKAATDRSPFILDTLDDGVRAVVAFSEQEGRATLAEMASHAAAGSLDRIH